MTTKWLDPRVTLPIESEIVAVLDDETVRPGFYTIEDEHEIWHVVKNLRRVIHSILPGFSGTTPRLDTSIVTAIVPPESIRGWQPLPALKEAYCCCGDITALGVVHRTDGPCYIPVPAPAPAWHPASEPPPVGHLVEYVDPASWNGDDWQHDWRCAKWRELPADEPPPAKPKRPGMRKLLPKLKNTDECGSTHIVIYEDGSGHVEDSIGNEVFSFRKFKQLLRYLRTLPDREVTNDDSPSAGCVKP